MNCVAGAATSATSAPFVGDEGAVPPFAWRISTAANSADEGFFQVSVNASYVMEVALSFVTGPGAVDVPTVESGGWC